MQIRCRNCTRPFALNRDEVHAALERMYAENFKHYDSRCPHCGKNNQVSLKELKRFAPNWSPASVEEPQAE